MELALINKKLKELYGAPTDVLPNFRIVWSEHEYENKFGHYDDYYGSIYLRTYIGVRRVKKYQHDPPAYVLERLFPNDTNEIVGAKYTYEPLYVFKGEDGMPLELSWRAIQFIMWTLLYGPKRAADVACEALGSPERMQQEIDLICEELDNKRPYIADQLVDGHAVVNPWAGGV